MQKRKKVENEEKNLNGLQKKAKANYKYGLFLITKSQWKLFQDHWEVREFFTFWWVATMFVVYESSRQITVEGIKAIAIAKLSDWL